MLIYTTDSDDVFPISHSIDDGGACGYGKSNAGRHIGVQVGWASTIPAGADDPSCAQIDGVSWINSTQPYRKSYELTLVAGAPQFDSYFASTISTFVKAPAVTSLAMNGLLSEYNATAVASPSKNPLIWMGQYKNNFRAASILMENPAMYCIKSAQCKFSAGTPPDGASWAPTTNRGEGLFGWVNLDHSWWMYGKGFIYASTDSSAHFQNVGNGGSRSYATLSVDAGGNTGVTLRCTTTGAANGYYSSFFRPDSDYNYPTNANQLPCGW